jgi:anthranilate synthase component 2
MTPHLLVVDNYDSFTYNLVQELGVLGADVEVVRNDVVPMDELVADPPDGVVISPGPGTPRDAGQSLAVIAAMAGVRPLLGVCLGHQAIGEHYGGTVVAAPELRHGKTSPVHHDDHGVMRGLPSPFDATRYHSLVVRRDDFPTELRITAETADGIIMGLEHRSLAVHGVQFHPESILTGSGRQLLANFLDLVRVARSDVVEVASA